MPRFDLRDGNFRTSFAKAKVLAVMLAPSRLPLREAILARIMVDSGEGNGRRKPLSDSEFSQLARRSTSRGAIAGSLLLTRLQLFENGLDCSINKALPLINNWLPRWIQPLGADAREGWIDHIPTNRAGQLDANKEFVSVAHLWAAHMHDLQQGGLGMLPGPNLTLIGFLAAAESFLSKSERLPTKRRDRSTHPSRPAAWVFDLPEDLRTTVEHIALSLDEVRAGPITT